MTLNINPFTAQRKRNKLELADFIRHNPELEPERIIALFSLKTGLRPATIKEYWDELFEAGIIENDWRNPADRRIERGREIARQINERRSGASSDNERTSGKSK